MQGASFHPWRLQPVITLLRGHPPIDFLAPSSVHNYLRTIQTFIKSTPTADARNDPCGCLTQNGMVVCTQGHIVALGLQANGLSGTIPAELADLRYLDSLHLEGNHAVPGRGTGLRGVLPELPFSSYTACGLEGGVFDCPLPEGANEFCSSGQELICGGSGGIGQ